jgi:hypothetical protein
LAQVLDLQLLVQTVMLQGLVVAVVVHIITPANAIMPGMVRFLEVVVAGHSTVMGLAQVAEEGMVQLFFKL